MVTTIAVVSDTHCMEWEEVHPGIRAAISEADIAVHCGDFTKMSVVEGMRREARHAVLVHGNSDPVEVRRALPPFEVFQVDGVRIGATHPAWGGPPFALDELLQDFESPLDVVLFGHLHETCDEMRDDVLFVSPGQGYRSFMVPATIAVVTVEGGMATAEIRVIEAADERRKLRNEV